MYTEFAANWRLISAPENYAKEAAFWRAAIRSRLGPGRHSVLELGVGWGHNMSHLTNDFEFTAADISPPMIEQAHELNPGVEFHVGDMRTIRLGRTFDAVLIHDAITYMLTEDDLQAAFATANVHLREAGVLVTSPDWFKETFRDPTVSYGTKRNGPMELTILEYEHDRDPLDTMYESLMWYLIRENGGTPRVEEDRHVFGLFSLATWERLIAKAGFRVEKDAYDVHEDSRESYLLVGIKQE